MIHFVHVKESNAEIDCQFVSVYSENVKNEQNGVMKFKEEDVIFVMK